MKATTSSSGTIRVIAVDWSGNKANSDQKKAIWLSEIQDGKMACLEACWTRDSIVQHLIAESRSTRKLVVGLDFAFSFPQWFCTGLEAESGPALWEIVSRRGEEWLSHCASPFWGRPGRRRPDLPDHYRATEEEIVERFGVQPGSVFQIHGRGSVGTGSIRGMPLLLELSKAGFHVWPFQPPKLPLVIEIYPRALLHKRKRPSLSCDRESYLETHHPGLKPLFFGKAIADDNAFDAAISALAMSRNLQEILQLEQLTDPPHNIEGKIWLPQAHHRQ